MRKLLVQPGFLSVLSALLLSACSGNEAAAKANNLSDVSHTYVRAESCAEGIRQALGERGIGVVNSEAEADATLSVQITSQGRNLDEIPEFGGFGDKASYSAKLYGAGDEILFSTAGEEGSLTYEEMCQDIGDEIAQRMREAKNR